MSTQRLTPKFKAEAVRQVIECGSQERKQPSTMAFEPQPLCLDSMS